MLERSYEEFNFEKAMEVLKLLGLDPDSKEIRYAAQVICNAIKDPLADKDQLMDLYIYDEETPNRRIVEHIIMGGCAKLITTVSTDIDSDMPSMVQEEQYLETYWVMPGIRYLISSINTLPTDISNY